MQATALTAAGLLAASGLVMVNAVASNDAAIADSAPADVWGSSDPFYVYLKSGESLRAQADGDPVGGAAHVGVIDQAGNTQLPAAGDIYGPATADGIWEVDAGGVWDISAVAADGSDVPGRVWSNLYNTEQPGIGDGDSANLQFWMVNDAGYIYDFTANDYNGILSRIRADSIGNETSPGSCLPSYESTGNETNDWNPIPDCAGTYRVFFAPPAADLPARATSADGDLTVLPEPLTDADLAVDDLAFSPSSPNAAEGTFTWSIDERFTGAYTLQIDVDGDGTFDGPTDRTLLQYADGSGSYQAEFDGDDGSGTPIADCTSFNARIHFDKVGEIHVVQDDVEDRVSGISLTRTNGPGAPDSTVYWDDTSLPNNRTNTTPMLDGTAGVDSAAGVHGWGSDANSWGNGRAIDDWTYRPADVGGTVLEVGGECDFGDAPDTFGTVLSSDGARHVMPGYDADAHTAPVMLGEHIDAEEDGQPNTAADGDDTNGVNDEDGVTFNADLGYDQPAVLTGYDPNTLQPIENTMTVNASADGFVSAWIDWNEDGVFDADEQVAASQPVTAGDNIVTFSQADNPPGIHTHVRVRYSTDADAIASPTGNAPDGEVEDYQVLVQRLTTPDSCTVSDIAHYAFTFDQPVDLTGTGGVGSSARYEDVSVIDGVPVDMVATVVGGGLSGSGFAVGTGGIFDTDDAIWHIASDATIEYSFYRAGTTEPVDVSAVFTINDLDGPPENTQESATFTTSDFGGDGLTYSVATGSRVTVVDSDGSVTFDGNGGHDGDPASRVQVTFDHTSQFRVHWQGFAQSGFGFDGDGDLAITPACSDYGDAPDSYGTTIDADGASHTLTAGLTLGTTVDIDPDGQPSGAADGDDTNRIADEDGVADPIVVTAGTTTTVTVSVTNDTDDAATLAGWIDLDGNGTFDAGELVTATVPQNSGTADYTLTFPVGTTSADTYARFRLFAGDVADPAPTGAVDGGEVEDYAVTVVDRPLTVEKTSDATADSRVGDTITYTVTATNTGTGAYTQDDPAVVADDLTGVLDDADYNGDASATRGDRPSYTSPTIVWSGALAAGQSVDITYSVTLKAGGDADVRNVAWQPDDPGELTAPTCDPRNADGTDPTTGEPCGAIDFTLPTVTIDKTADTTELPVDGGTVEFTVTVTNNSDSDFTADAPATASDDLSDVLDDADYNGDVTATVGEATFNANDATLDWTGVLAAGDSATITYSVTYDAHKAGGDHDLANLACVPAGLVSTGDTPCRSVEVPGAALQQRKSVDPASGTAVTAGQEVTYTLTFENTGKTDATVDTFDDLSGVLDDATLNGDAVVSDPALTATLNGEQLAIAGSVPAGETYTVSYTVTVNAFADQGDHDLANVLGGDDQCAQNDPTCRTDNPIRHVTLTKVADPAEGANTGDTVDYTVTVSNDGAGDYTETDPAVVADDLTGVNDDATFEQETASATSGALEYAAPILTWTGALASGDTVTITYSVTVTNVGDHSLENTVGPVCSDSEICDPPVTVEEPLPHVVASKTSDPGDGADVQAGDVVTYTLTWTNDGQSAGPVDSTDDLSNVLDDADVTSEPVSSAPDAVTATRTDEKIRVVGDIEPGQTVTVTYQVTVKPNGQHGDDHLGNVLAQDFPPFCDDGDPCPPPTTDHPVGDLDDWKTADPASGTSVQPGTAMTYTLHFANTGQAPVDVARDDDFTGVLDDADLTTEPASSDAALTVSAAKDGRFSVTGSLEAGQEETVTYTVTVKPDGQRGDDRLGNFIVDPDEAPPADGRCVPTDDQRPDCTVNDVSNIQVTKSADPDSGTKVESGQDVTYTLTFTNVSANPEAGDARVDAVDYMKDVIDDATLTAAPATSDAALTAKTVGDTIRVTGALASGQTVTVVYTVTVNSYDEQGDHELGNVVAMSGDDPVCAPNSRLCTDHTVSAPPSGPLAVTGSDLTLAELLTGMAAALLAVMAGVGLMLARRRTRQMN